MVPAGILDLRSRVWLVFVNRFNPGEYIIGQLHVEAVDIAFELLHRRCPNDVAGNERLLSDVSQRHLRGIKAVFTRQSDIAFAGSHGLWV